MLLWESWAWRHAVGQQECVHNVTHFSFPFQFEGATVESVNEVYALPIQLRVVGKWEEVFDRISLTELLKLERRELRPVVAGNRFGNTVLVKQLVKDCHS